MQNWTGTGDRARTLLFQSANGLCWWNLNVHATRDGAASDPGVIIDLYQNGGALKVGAPLTSGRIVLGRSTTAVCLPAAPRRTEVCAAGQVLIDFEDVLEFCVRSPGPGTLWSVTFWACRIGDEI